MSYPTLLSLALFFTYLAAEEAPLLTPEESLKIQTDYQKLATEAGQVMFDPPPGWKIVDPKMLTKHIKIMLVGTSKGHYPPSVNLAFDPFKGSLSDYLRGVKSYNDSLGAVWKDLGTLRTQAGDASLSQVDTPTKWGVERQMQVILLKDHTAWILTCSALKEEFARYYKEFFEAMKSLHINKENLEKK